MKWQKAWSPDDTCGVWGPRQATKQKKARLAQSEPWGMGERPLVTEYGSLVTLVSCCAGITARARRSEQKAPGSLRPPGSLPGERRVRSCIGPGSTQTWAVPASWACFLI